MVDDSEDSIMEDNSDDDIEVTGVTAAPERRKVEEPSDEEESDLVDSEERREVEEPAVAVVVDPEVVNPAVAVDLIALHRSRFNSKAFPGNKRKSKNSKLDTVEEWQECLYILRFWDEGDPEDPEAGTSQEFKRIHRAKGYSAKYQKREAKSYIDPIDNTEKWKIVMRENEKINVASMETAFDVIYDQHVIALGHQAVFTTQQGVKKTCSNISKQADCSIKGEVA
jgi:hypothetical protein